MIAALILLKDGLAVLAFLAFCATVVPAVPTHWVVGLGFVLQIWPQTWSVGGVLVDSFDVTLALVALSLALRGLPRGPSFLKAIPRLGAWLCLAALMSAAYAVSPDGGPNMTDPIRIVYQLYRYGVRFTILYPICCILVNTPRKFDQVLTFVMLGATAFAVMSIVQGYTGQRVNGPFLTKNELGAAIAVPIVVILVDMMRGRPSVLSLLSAPLLLRSALFVSSRGAFAGIFVGSVTALLFMFRGRVRTHLGGLIAATVMVLAIGILARPDVLERQDIARVFSTVDLGQETLRWRVQERWPHFARRALEHPWLGWGTDVDLKLGPTANTSHNGYLSLANKFGIPVLGLYLLFSFIAVRDAWRGSSRAHDAEDRVRAAKIGGAIACLLTHNLVDAVVATHFTEGELWLFAAVAASLAARLSERAAERAPSGSRHPVLALGAGS